MPIRFHTGYTSAEVIYSPGRSYSVYQTTPPESNAVICFSMNCGAMWANIASVTIDGHDMVEIFSTGATLSHFINDPDYPLDSDSGYYINFSMSGPFPSFSFLSHAYSGVDTSDPVGDIWDGATSGTTGSQEIVIVNDLYKERSNSWIVGGTRYEASYSPTTYVNISGLTSTLRFILEPGTHTPGELGGNFINSWDCMGAIGDLGDVTLYADKELTDQDYVVSALFELRSEDMDCIGGVIPTPSGFVPATPTPTPQPSIPYPLPSGWTWPIWPWWPWFPWPSGTPQPSGWVPPTPSPTPSITPSPSYGAKHYIYSSYQDEEVILRHDDPEKPVAEYFLTEWGNPSGKPGPFFCMFLVVGGGGGGGSWVLAAGDGGAGGAGGYIYVPGMFLDYGEYDVIIGDGGILETNGGDSKFIFTAEGGGAGAKSTDGHYSHAGANGGCGGGASEGYGTSSGGIGSQGYNGGENTSSDPGAGGGLGAGEGKCLGGQDTPGDGLQFAIFGDEYYGGGGGTSCVDAGLGGGGEVGESAEPNTGGGGGSGRYYLGQTGGTGGSGIVKIKYVTEEWPYVSGGTEEIDGVYSIRTFTESDTLVLYEFANGPTPTPTPSVTPSVTPSITPTISVTPSISATPSVTATPTATPTPSITPSISPTPSITPTPSNTPGPYYYNVEQYTDECVYAFDNSFKSDYALYIGKWYSISGSAGIVKIIEVGTGGGLYTFIGPYDTCADIP